jgi:hypothetical protein
VVVVVLVVFVFVAVAARPEQCYCAVKVFRACGDEVLF